MASIHGTNIESWSCSLWICRNMLQLDVRERALDCQQKVFPAKGFLQVIERAAAHGQHRALDRSEGSQKNDGQAGMRMVEAREDLLAGHAGHSHVQQQQVGGPGKRIGEALERI